MVKLTDFGIAKDVYDATGLLLYEMLAGRAPFEASSAVAVALAHQQLPPPPLISQRPDVPTWLEAVVQRALRKALTPWRWARYGWPATVPTARGSTAGTTATTPLEVTRTVPAVSQATATSRTARPQPRASWAVLIAVVTVLVLAATGMALEAGAPDPAGVESRTANRSLARAPRPRRRGRGNGPVG